MSGYNGDTELRLNKQFLARFEHGRDGDNLQHIDKAIGIGYDIARSG
jgi:hypothetical protein